MNRIYIDIHLYRFERIMDSTKNKNIFCVKKNIKKLMVYFFSSSVLNK